MRRMDSKRVSWLRPSGALLALAAVVVLSGCAGAPPLRSVIGEEAPILHLYLKAEGDQAGPYLDLSPDGGVDSYKAAADAPSGAAATAARMTGSTLPSYTFRMKSSFPFTAYLNLSKSVTGTLYISSQSLSASSHDHALLRIQLMVNDKIAGGATAFFPVPLTYSGWVPFGFSFRPEVSAILPGDEVAVKVIRLSGASDLVIGTGGTHASDFEFQYYTVDPLATAIYVERAGFVTGKPNSVDDPGDSGNAALALGGTLGPVALLGMARLPRRRRIALLVAVVFSTAGLAGCLSSGGGPSASSGAPEGTRSTVDQRYEDRPDLNGTGQIRGNITDEFGLPVGGAHVAILGTKYFTRASGQGSFGFEKVPPGRFTLRVDKEPFLPIEEPIQVEKGRVLYLTIVLAKPSTGSPNAKPHPHDDWQGQPKMDIVDKDILPVSYFGAVPPATNLWACLGFALCETPIPLEAGKPVLPGTSYVEVLLQGTMTAGFNDWELRVVTAGNRSQEQFFVGRPLGVPYRIPIFPNEADPGHQKASAWEFYFRPTTTNSLYDGLAPPVNAGGKIHAKITIHKGVIPLEPAHRDMWGNLTEMVLATNVKSTWNCATCDFPQDGYEWSPQGKAMVPVGTSKVVGKLTWTNPSLPTGTDWKLVYRGADAVGGKGPWKPVVVTRALTNGFEFSITPGSNEPDQFYQLVSYWRFAVDDGSAPLVLNYGANTGYNTEWFFSATAVRDPAYVDA